jgi:hypothetical protein
MVSTPALYVGDSEFDSQPYGLLSLTTVFCGFPQFLQANIGK